MQRSGLGPLGCKFIPTNLLAFSTALNGGTGRFIEEVLMADVPIIGSGGGTGRYTYVKVDPDPIPNDLCVELESGTFNSVLWTGTYTDGNPDHTFQGPLTVTHVYGPVWASPTALFRGPGGCSNPGFVPLTAVTASGVSTPPPLGLGNGVDVVVTYLELGAISRVGTGWVVESLVARCDLKKNGVVVATGRIDETRQGSLFNCRPLPPPVVFPPQTCDSAGDVFSAVPHLRN